MRYKILFYGIYWIDYYYCYSYNRFTKNFLLFSFFSVKKNYQNLLSVVHYFFYHNYFNKIMDAISGVSIFFLIILLVNPFDAR